MIQWNIDGIHSLVIQQFSIEKGHRQFVSFSIKSGDFPYSRKRLPGGKCNSRRPFSKCILNLKKREIHHGITQVRLHNGSNNDVIIRNVKSKRPYAAL